MQQVLLPTEPFLQPCLFLISDSQKHSSVRGWKKTVYINLLLGVGLGVGQCVVSCRCTDLEKGRCGASARLFTSGTQSLTRDKDSMRCEEGDPLTEFPSF